MIGKKLGLNMASQNKMKKKPFLFFDVVYQSFLMNYFLQLLIKNGIKTSYENKFLHVLLLISFKLKLCAFLFFFEVLEKNKSILELNFKKSIYKTKIKFVLIPIYLNQYQQYKKTLRFLKLNLLFSLNKRPIVYKLLESILDLYLYKNNFVNKKNIETYKYSIINKFNKHYR
jgi:hypothetical protein